MKRFIGDFDWISAIKSGNYQKSGLSKSDRIKVLLYMKNKSLETLATSNNFYDPITGKLIHTATICFENTDYIWSNAEIYVFQKYDVKLNSDFVDMAIRTDYVN